MYDSDIYTLSLGDTRDVVFKRKGGSHEEIVQTAKGNSLYVMSSTSQQTWTHRIDPSNEKRDLRYSITLRYISKNNNNVTIICGDSNTRHLNFGGGKKTFGDKMPGKRVESFIIDEIKPERCVGYNNVFVHCGVNDIKRKGVIVEECVDRLVCKINEICELCPTSRITVSPILPTKLNWLNERGLHFNRLLFNYVNNVNNRVGTLNFTIFCNKDNLLDNSMGRYNDEVDKVHLGSTGIFTLSQLVSKKVFSRAIDGRLFSSVVPNNRPLRLSGL